MVGAKPAAGLAALSDDERQFLIEGLLLRRYVNFKLPSGVPDAAGETQAYVALAVARKLGLFQPYFELMQAQPVLSVAVRNLEVPKPRDPRDPGGGKGEPFPSAPRGRGGYPASFSAASRNSRASAVMWL